MVSDVALEKYAEQFSRVRVYEPVSAQQFDLDCAS
jgi:hypothetical protein